MRIRAVALLCLALSGCAEGACKSPQEDSEVPLLRLGNHEIAPVLINGEPAGLVLDTGANGTTVTPQAVEALHLGTHTLPIRATGIGGTTYDQATEIDQLKVGGAEVSGAAALVVPLSKEGLDKFPAFGLLGEDLLTSWDLDLDAAQDRLTLYEPQQCALVTPPWSRDVQTIGMPRALTGEATQAEDIPKGLQAVARRQSTYTGEILFPVTLDGHVLTAELDSGAGGSIVRESALGFDGASLAAGQIGRVAGINMMGIAIHFRDFAHLRIGTTDYGPTTMAVGNMQIPGVDVLLGEDFLRRHRVYVAFHAGKLFIARDP